VTAGCSNSSSSAETSAEQSAKETTAPTDNASTSDAADETEWAATELTEYELESGGKISLEVSIGKPIAIINPDEDTGSECGIQDLPKAGTTFQHIKVRVTSLSSRSFPYPRVLVGYLREDGSYTSLWKNYDFSIGSSPVPRSCAPRDLVDISYNATASHIGMGEFEMGPQQTDEISDLLTLDPDAPKNLTWALLVTSSSDEAETSGNLTKESLTPGATFIPLHKFGTTSLPGITPKPSSGSNLTADICKALRELDSPNAEPLDGMRMNTLRKAGTISDYDLGSLALGIVKWFETHPNDDVRPFSHGLATSRCDDLGL
jgi:hypothetical protein